MADGSDHAHVHLDRPSLARVYDYFLDGSLNTPLDRALAASLEEACPLLPRIVRQQRRFLQRAVQHLLALGVRQFIDLGSGVPTAGHLHHIAHTHPDGVVIYVDDDPTTINQAQLILRGERSATAVLADLRHPSEVLRHPNTQRLIDRQQPVGITMIGVLEHISDTDDPASLISAYRSASDVATYTAITLLTTTVDPEVQRQLSDAAEIYRSAGAQLIARPGGTLNNWLDTKALIDPGITPASRWTPTGQPTTHQPDPSDGLIECALIRQQLGRSRTSDS